MSSASRKFSGALLLYAFLTFNVCAATPQQSAAKATPPPLASADSAMRAGRFADAARAYEAWLRARPDAKEVMLALAVCYVQLGRHAEAEAVLRRHLKLAPASAPARAALGVVLLDGARNEEAKAELERAVRLDPGQADAAEALARIYLVEGRAAEAAALLRPPAEAGAGGEETKALLADALVKSGQAGAAAEMLGRELLANPQGAAALYAAAGWAHLKAGDLAAAAEVCERGMRLYPDSEIEAVYLSLPAPFLAERVGARVERLRQAPDPAELIALGRVLTDADPARKTRAGEIAQKLLAHAVQLAPDSASARYNYGRALVQTEAGRALAEWEKALALRPDDDLRLQILIKVAAARLDLSDLGGSEDAFREALEINRRLPRRRPEAGLEYVRFLQLRSRDAEAETLLEEVIRWNPLSPRARLERAKLLALRGRWEKVAEEGEFVLRSAGEDTETLRAAHMLLARAYLRLNRPEQARRHREWIDSH